MLHKIAFSGDRTQYLTEFRRAIDALIPYTHVFSQQFDPGVIHQQIVQHLSAAVLDSDLAALCVRASQEGSARFEHRLPPGFRDSNKGENRFGDLIIWFEILEKSTSSATDFPNVLFITNDEKSDWVYTPKMRTEIVGSARKSVGNTNPEIKLADPRLVSEFQRRTGHASFVICSLATLVEGLSKVSAMQFAQLAAAIQIDTEEPAQTFGADGAASEESPPDRAPTPTEPPTATVEALPPREEPGTETPEPPQPIQPLEPAALSLHYDQNATEDSEYQADAPSDINAIIRALKSLNWYTQNPAIVRISAIRNEDFTPSSWFVLGRNIYQAACGNSQKAMEFMAGLESQLGVVRK
ncbi:Peptidase C14, caspase catalytic subunit p20 (fragment) [Thiomonas sp. X19]|uniref:PIN-like domain-containing protein n=1 Tax=Thiomonas sp. X19 TaxID=1050370 RepID=UPI000B6F456E